MKVCNCPKCGGYNIEITTSGIICNDCVNEPIPIHTCNHKDCISKEDIRKLRHAFELDDAELVTKRLIIDALNNLLSKNKE